MAHKSSSGTSRFLSCSSSSSSFLWSWIFYWLSLFFYIYSRCLMTASICFFIISCWICLIAIPTSIGLAVFYLRPYNKSLSLFDIYGYFSCSWVIIWVSICICIAFCCYGLGWAICGIIFCEFFIICCCIFIPTLCWIWKSLSPWPSVSFATSSLNRFCNLYISNILGSSLFMREMTLSRHGWEGICGMR